MRKPLCIAVALWLAGCHGNSTSGSLATAAGAMPPGFAPKDVVATVNGKPIPRSALAAAHPGGQVPEAQRIDDLIAREVVRQYAEQRNLAAAPAFAEKVDNFLRFSLSQLAAEDFVKTNPISDADVKKAYEAKVATLGGTEYRARHILVDSEAAAKEAIARLNKGAKFDELARKLSKDPGSKEHGGELGWFSPRQLVAPFSAAVEGLKDGEITATPVQTQFGWHVIQREESRAQQPPPFDQVKDQVRTALQMEKFQERVEELKKTAKIERAATKAAQPAGAAPAHP